MTGVPPSGRLSAAASSSMDRSANGTGIGRYSAAAEKTDHDRATREWEARVKAAQKQGHGIGTHTLGLVLP